MNKDRLTKAIVFIFQNSIKYFFAYIKIPTEYYQKKKDFKKWPVNDINIVMKKKKIKNVFVKAKNSFLKMKNKVQQNIEEVII